MKKIGVKGVVKAFSVDCNAIDTSVILGIHKYLMKKTCLDLLKKNFKKLMLLTMQNVYHYNA